MLRKLIRGQPVVVASQAPALSQQQRAALAHFPRDPLPQIPASEVTGWPFPIHLDNPNCRWLQALKHVYSDRITFPASLSPQAGQLVHAIVLNAQPRVAIETGTFLGISTIWIAAALELSGAGHLHCIDDFRPIKKGRWREEEILGGRDVRVRQHLDMAGLAHRVTLHNADSAAGIQTVRQALHSGHSASRGGVQLAFLDADHTPAGVQSEFAALEPILDTGGYVILHDIYPEVSRWRGPRQLMDHIHQISTARYECVDLYLAPANFGLGVMRRIG